MEPNTTVTLYATDFDITNKHVVFADSEGAALAAVSSFPSRVYTNCYWQRTDSFVFRATGNINDVEKYNYAVFLNNGKYNFAFITKCQYINDDMTWVYLEIDPWLNFAGQYTFEDSPMRRCHPETDSVLNGSYAAEPIPVSGWKQEVFADGFEAGGDAEQMFLVLSVDVSTMPTQSNNLIQGLYDLLSYYGAGASGLINWGITAMKSTATRCGNKVQAATYHVTRTQAADILSKLAANGMQNAAICAYNVPSFFGASLVPTMALPQVQINAPGVLQEQIPIDWGGNTIFWNKLKYSPQFNEIVVNLAGNAKEIPVGYLNPNQLIAGTLTAEIHSDLSMDGCATCVIRDFNTAVGDNTMFIVHSPAWDRVNISAMAANQNKLIASEVATIGGVLKAGVGAVLGGAVGAGLAMAESVIGGALDYKENVTQGTVTTGGAGSSISSFNQSAPLFSVTHMYPQETEFQKIQEYFGTYGYSWEGRKHKIIFQNMPHWNYYETISAVITGRGVPQKYLNQVINMFNSGVFVYNTIGDYKKLSNAISNHL